MSYYTRSQANNNQEGQDLGGEFPNQAQGYNNSQQQYGQLNDQDYNNSQQQYGQLNDQGGDFINNDPSAYQQNSQFSNQQGGGYQQDSQAQSWNNQGINNNNQDIDSQQQNSGTLADKVENMLERLANKISNRGGGNNNSGNI